MTCYTKDATREALVQARADTWLAWTASPPLTAESTATQLAYIEAGYALHTYDAGGTPITATLHPAPWSLPEPTQLTPEDAA